MASRRVSRPRGWFSEIVVTFEKSCNLLILSDLESPKHVQHSLIFLNILCIALIPKRFEIDTLFLNSMVSAMWTSYISFRLKIPERDSMSPVCEYLQLSSTIRIVYVAIALPGSLEDMFDSPFTMP